jgi:hypothetical protein
MIRPSEPTSEIHLINQFVQFLEWLKKPLISIIKVFFVKNLLLKYFSHFRFFERILIAIAFFILLCNCWIAYHFKGLIYIFFCLLRDLIIEVTLVSMNHW